MRIEGNKTILETEEELREDFARTINRHRQMLLMKPLPVDKIFTRKGKFRKNLFKRCDGK